MRRKSILVVEDEVQIAEVIEAYLQNAGFSVVRAICGKDALTAFDQFALDLVILDLMLPGLSGEEVCQQIRRKSRVPIIMLTAKVMEDDVVKGLDLGADDYMTKPFSPRQLLARVRAVLRRTEDETFPLSNQISFNNGDLVIDSLRHEVRKRGELVSLTPNEFRILTTMIKYPSKVFTRDELIEQALSEDYEGNDRAIDSHIKNIRQKIEDDSRNPRYVQTIYGVGYKFGGNG